MCRVYGRGGNPHYLPYGEAQQIVRGEGIRSRGEYWRWYDFYMPLKVMPKYPNNVYSEWQGWRCFLGNNNKFRGEKRVYVPFAEALRYARKCSCKSFKEWLEVNHPVTIPRRPDSFYRDNGWRGWRYFLGSGMLEVAYMVEFKQEFENNAKLCTRHPYQFEEVPGAHHNTCGG